MDSWRIERLRSDRLDVAVLPERGGDINSLVHRPTGSELLWRAPWPTPAGPSVPAGADFHEWYLGGWQSLLPNGEAPCMVDGVEHEQHGESWRLAGEWRRESASAATFRLELDVLPLRSERRIEALGDTLRVTERVRNEGTVTARFMWGHHPAWGGDLLAPGSRVDVPGARTRCYGAEVDSTARLATEGEGSWPTIPARGGGECDLSLVPGPQSRSHDVALLTDLADGWYAIRNPMLGLGVAVSFPRELFQWLWMWQPFGGATIPPFDRGTYALALEPWSSRPCLAKAVEAGEELSLAPGEMVEATVEATTFVGATQPVSSVAPGGRVEFEAAVA